MLPSESAYLRYTNIIMNIKKRHHYLPKVYLEGFPNLEDGRIWTYDKFNPYNPWSSSITNTAFTNKLYHVKDSEQDLDIVENYFANNIEGPAATPLKILREQKFPELEGRKALAAFFSLLIVRTPGYLKHIEQQYSRDLAQQLMITAKNKEYFHQIYKKAGIKESFDIIEKARLSILNGEVSVTLHKNRILDIMLKMSLPIETCFLNMHWALIKTNEEYPFITSDNPFFLNNPNISQNSFYKPGLSMPGTCAFIPISSYLTLMMVTQKDFIDGQIFNVDQERYDSNGNKINIPQIVEMLNDALALALNCYKYIYYFKNCDNIKKILKNQSKMT